MATSSVSEEASRPNGAPAATLLAIVPDHAAALASGAGNVLVLDTTWTPARTDEGDAGPGEDGDREGEAGGRRILDVRTVAERVLSSLDLIHETSERLDAWAEASGVVEALRIDETSFWYHVRLRHWTWLQERILWALILDDVMRALRPTVVTAPAGLDVALRDVLPLIAARDGCILELEPEPEPVAAGPAATLAPPGATGRPAAGSAARHGPAQARAARPPASFPRRLLRGIRRGIVRAAGVLQPPPPPDPAEVRRKAVLARLEALAAEPPRLLVVCLHEPQQVEGDDGPRLINPYLDPIVDRLGGTPLEPVRLDMRARMMDDAAWSRIEAPGSERELPSDVLLLEPVPMPEAALEWAAPPVPVPVAGIDLGPALVADVVAAAGIWLPRMRRSVDRIERLLRRLRPSAILLADEYHRQDWLAAGRRTGVRVAAVQHGLIYPRHNGYIHRVRPPQLHLAARTYVFGNWERDLLVNRSVYRPDEVVVGGSARLDLVREDPAASAELRRELGIAAGERMVLISGTWGRIYRRFHYPIALAHVVDRPLPGVHFVVKHHPSERDDGPYDAIIAGAAAAGGFDPPPVTHVRSVDLYRALAASDAHLGIHSTLLTEAVVTRTRNLLADQLHAADLLGYVDAGVAIPVRDGGDLLRALDPATAPMSEDAAAAFVRRHFEPGESARRIADDLVAWLA